MGNNINSDNFFSAYWNALIFTLIVNSLRGSLVIRVTTFNIKTTAGMRVFPVGSRQSILLLKARENFSRTLTKKPSLPLFGNSVLLQVKTRSTHNRETFQTTPKTCFKRKINAIS